MGICLAMRGRADAETAVGHHVERLHICKQLQLLSGQVVARCDAADACYLVAMLPRPSCEDDTPPEPTAAPAAAPAAGGAGEQRSLPRTASKASTSGVSVGGASATGDHAPPSRDFPAGYYLMHKSQGEDSPVSTILAAVANGTAKSLAGQRPASATSILSRTSGRTSLDALTGQGDGAPALIVSDEESRDLLHRAVEMYNIALPLCHRTGQYNVAARAHAALGATHMVLGECHASIQDWHQAAALYQEQGDRTGMALALEQIGVNYSMLNCLKVRVALAPWALHWRRPTKVPVCRRRQDLSRHSVAWKGKCERDLSTTGARKQILKACCVREFSPPQCWCRSQQDLRPSLKG